ncbi:selenium-dependent molybdenum cofactor biosynthesis protein YqeB [Anaeroselena agilis]|uniref:Selenium-dependent molybdenum cofactor biosynthesis protein YqeB n=1 Tax=Anaeroselena agilis TaxID=3063788 RepID=A0ABU3P0H1_9FIRM|nr:selenium-dependent molybdenum cofactor biosynthesis protein YqeB [Selenomonadales bacterium 4137-cl]
MTALNLDKENRLIVIKGAGDLATGVAHRLFRSGFAVVMTELAQPTVIRLPVAFAAAVFNGRATVEGVTAVRTEPADAVAAACRGLIAVVVDPGGDIVKAIRPWAVVDAILAKRNTGTRLDDAPVVVGLGPGFAAGRDAGYVVETARGHYLGRVIDHGEALPDTGVPGLIDGYGLERLLRAPAAGAFRAARAIGDTVAAGETVGHVGGLPVPAVIGGVLRGLIHDGLAVAAGQKIGDIDPRGRPEHCFTISDKARAVGGGVLEALLAARTCRCH